MKVGSSVKFGRAGRRAASLLGAAVAVAALSGFTYGPGPSTEASAAMPAQAVAQAGPGCNNYTPTQLALDTTLYIAGDVIIITGIAEPNDSVTATLSGGTIGTITLGTATADGSGQFSISGTLPDPLTAGSYTASVTSTQCPNPGTLTVVVIDVKSSSCNASRETRTFYPGQRVSFTLFTPIYSTAHPVSITLIRPSYSNVLYNGPWPSNDKVKFTIPATAALGSDYVLQQEGTRKNGKGNDTKSCPIWIEAPPAQVLAAMQQQSDQSGTFTGNNISANGVAAGVETEAANSSTSGVASALAITGVGVASPLAIAGVVLLAGFSLVQLRRRQSA